jgi:hypothetical protein
MNRLDVASSCVSGPMAFFPFRFRIDDQSITPRAIPKTLLFRVIGAVVATQLLWHCYSGKVLMSKFGQNG